MMKVCNTAFSIWWLMLGRSSSVVVAIDSVRVAKSCFKLGEAIDATFSVTNPKNGDWVGLTPSSSDLFGAVKYEEFLYTCGTSSCVGSLASGTVTFWNNMPAGSYVAVLLPENTFTPLAVSSIFSVNTTCPTPPVAPTRPTTTVVSPTSRPVMVNPPTTRPVVSPTVRPVVNNPTVRPVANPTLRPTPSPITLPAPVVAPRPTVRPVSPTSRPTSGSTIDLVAAKQAIQQASVQITAMVQKDKLLLQQYLRLLFHDCHGICDGCVDMSNQDNGLLDLPIKGLDPIVQQFATPQTGLSRADIWVLAMVIALNNANQQPTSNPVTFEMNWIGRKDCEKRNPDAVCTDAQGRPIIPCGALSGPKRPIASVNMNSLDFANFWRTNFNNITLRQGVALMGCHTVGRFFTQVSGIDGPNGWVVDNLSFNNEYFQALLGSRATPNMTFAELLTVAPVWQRAVQSNAGTTLPTRHFWTLTAGGKRLIMTNADISFVRQLNSSNMNPTTGQVSCGFATARRSPPVCPGIDTIKFAAEFLDNDTWLKAVKEALDLMTTNGYQRGPCPAGQLCVLQDV